MSSYLPITKLSDIMTPKLISKNITAAIRPSSAGLLSIVNWFLRWKDKNHAMLAIIRVCLMIQSMSLPRKKFASPSLFKDVFLTAIKNNGSYPKKMRCDIQSHFAIIVIKYYNLSSFVRTKVAFCQQAN